MLKIYSDNELYTLNENYFNLKLTGSIMLHMLFDYDSLVFAILNELDSFPSQIDRLEIKINTDTHVLSNGRITMRTVRTKEQNCSNKSKNIPNPYEIETIMTFSEHKLMPNA